MRTWELDPLWAEACRIWAPGQLLAPKPLTWECCSVQTYSLPKKTPKRREPTWLSRAIPSVTVPFSTLSLNIPMLMWIFFGPYFPLPSLCKYKRGCSHLPTKTMTKSIWAAVWSCDLFSSLTYTDKLGDAHTQEEENGPAGVLFCKEKVQVDWGIPWWLQVLSQKPRDHFEIQYLFWKLRKCWLLHS